MSNSFKLSVGTVKVSTGMTGKMRGIESLSTSTDTNPICQARRNCKGSVCEHCFAHRTLSMYKQSREAYAQNGEVLANHLLSKREAGFIRFSTALGRIESFGDVANVIQARNYIRIVRGNPQTMFGAWTKNPEIWDEAFAIEGKPRNLSMVVSSMWLNKELDASKLPAWVDYTFTVYTKEYIKEHDVFINCGARSCSTCHRCYDRYKKKNGIVAIREELK